MKLLGASEKLGKARMIFPFHRFPLPRGLTEDF